MRYIFLITALLLSSAAQSKPVDTFGIVSVPEIHADKLSDCEYLGLVDTTGKWLNSGYNNPWGRKSTKKKFYKKAREMGATHILVPSEGTEKIDRHNVWDGVYEINAQGYRCEDATDTDQKKPETPTYIDELKALATLRDDGIISETEFQKQKAEILERE